ncbi:MAG TPA: glycerate-2-kinase family protein, partial [Acidimicrobiia bacterium]|nr:glycerate-2-kinase family protein [Acidimicrobiia bacterium]
MTGRLRQDAVAIFTAGVESAHPGGVMAEALAQQAWNQPVEVIAFGKAACSMMAAALAGLPPGLLQSEALAITDDGNAVDHPRARVMVAGHPLPDQAGLRAAEVVRERLRRAGKSTTLLTLISGGGSALLPAPVPGVSLDDKVAATGLLLACGARIDEINTVRKHLSTLKGGWMTALAFPAQVRSLILSDVPDDDPGVIGSGPTVPDPTTFADALAVIDRY